MKINQRVVFIPKRNSEVRGKLSPFSVEDLFYLNEIQDGKSTERKDSFGELGRDTRPDVMHYGKPDKELTVNASVERFASIKVPQGAHVSCSSGRMGKPFRAQL